MPLWSTDKKTSYLLKPIHCVGIVELNKEDKPILYDFQDSNIILQIVILFMSNQK
jgi:hypothetical protein